MSHRLVTRADLDGMVCAALLKEIGMIKRLFFAHPKDIQDRRINITDSDITANLPYHPDALMAFDHHASEEERIGNIPDNFMLDTKAPSSAHVIYNSFGGRDRFPAISEEMIAAVDKAHSGQFCANDIFSPEGWTLLHFMLDPRTGLGRFRCFDMTCFELINYLSDFCRDHAIDDIMALPEIKKRVALYRAHQSSFIEQLRRCTTLMNGIAIIDLRDEKIIYSGNRFMVYALFPEAHISIHKYWGRGKRNVVLAAGKSILNRKESGHIGELMLLHGGRGHANVGSCQIPANDIGEVEETILQSLKKTA